MRFAELRKTWSAKLNKSISEFFRRIIQSVGAKGRVYKIQGRNQLELMTRAHQEFHAED